MTIFQVLMEVFHPDDDMTDDEMVVVPNLPNLNEGMQRVCNERDLLQYLSMSMLIFPQ